VSSDQSAGRDRQQLAFGSVTSVLPRAIDSLLEGGGSAAQRIDLVMIAALGLLLLEYDLLRAYFGQGR
jgi:hypothetical protein